MGDAVVVIGVGNQDRGDDGVGPEVLARLAGRLPGETRMVRLFGDDPAAFMEAWSGAGRAIVIDAMVSGAAPGTLARFEAGSAPLPPGLAFASTHAFGAGTAVEMARALGRLPARLTVYGVEGRDFAAGTGLSPAVAAAVALVVDQVLEEAVDA